MTKILIAFFSRADENYFAGAMRYVKVGNTEIVCGIIKDLTGANSFKIEMKDPYSPVYMTCIEEAKKAGGKFKGKRAEVAFRERAAVNPGRKAHETILKNESAGTDTKGPSLCFKKGVCI